MSGGVFAIALFTLLCATAATALALPFGVALGWALGKRSWPGKALVETLATLPLVVPPVATGLLLLRVFGRRGPLGAFLSGVGLDVVFTWRAVVLAMAVMGFPLLVRGARSAFESVDPRLERVARSLGAGEWRVFFAVTLPLALRGLAGGTLLAFARALGEFGATILVAGAIPERTETLSVAIWGAIQLGQDGRAGRLALVSVGLAFLSLFAAERLLAPVRPERRR